MINAIFSKSVSPEITMLPFPFAIIDLETTGMSPNYERVIEVGICLVEDGILTEEWSTLVNPGKYIPPFIEQHTGITAAMVRQAPRFEDVIDEVHDRIAGRVIVAHNAAFDMGFLKNEFLRCGMTFSQKSLCTVRLSRALFPKERRHGLDALIERFNLPCKNRHRALDDARALWHLLRIFAECAGEENLHEATRKVLKRAATPPNLPEKDVDALPQTPGVYRFYGENDALLYVGKSTNMRSRVLGHFSSAHQSGKEMRIKQQVQRIEHQETAGELGALLAESKQVKELLPIHNRRLRRSNFACSLTLQRNREGFLQPQLIQLSKVPQEGLGDLYGLFRNKKAVDSYLGSLIDDHGLCARLMGLEKGDGPCFSYQVKKCKGACVGIESHKMHDARLMIQFAKEKVKSWPFKGRIAIREHNPETDQSELHLFNHWCYLGTVGHEEDLDDLLANGQDLTFDMDCYRILTSFMERSGNNISLIEI
jgi:DNA polymerase-3 subunit epsilon